MNYTLDTSGAVTLILPNGYSSRWTWPDLDAFTQGYVEAVCRAAEATLGGFTMTGVRFSDLAPEALAMILADCAGMGPVEPRAFKAEALRLMGAQFWRQRQAYPAGWRYNDAKTFFPLTVSLGDGGKVHLAVAS